MKAKLAVAKREMDETAKFLGALQRKYEKEGRPGLKMTLEFYIKELNFDP